MHRYVIHISKLSLTIHDVSFANALKYDAIFAEITKYATVKSMTRWNSCMHDSEYDNRYIANDWLLSIKKSY